MSCRLLAVLATALLSTPALVSTTAFALPLLSENAAQNQGSALTLYPDSESSNLYYFFPNSSEFAIDQSSSLPAFGLTYWGLEPDAADAGAYMTFTMRLDSDKEQAKALDDAMRAGKQIAVLPVMASTIGLTAIRNTQSATPGTPVQTGPGATFPLGRLFDEFDFAEHAGRAEDEVGVNSVLTKIGAKVFKSAIDNPQLVKFDYCYQVQGLGPNFNATIDLDWLRIYDDYQLHASVGGWWYRYQIDAEVEKLRQNGSIKIVINGGDAKDEEYVKSIADKIVEKLFVPELQAQPTSGGNQGGWSFASLSVKITDRQELKEEHWSLTRRDMVTREFCVPMSLMGLAQYKDKLVHNADATH
jgi:hypothetical protein